MSYDLTIRFDDEATATTHVSSIEGFLSTYPGTERVTRNQWVHEPNSSVHVEIDLVPVDEELGESINCIGIGVPYPFLAASGELALKLCFALGEHLGWRVFDEQIDEYINAADIKDLVATQAEIGELASGTRYDKWLDHWAHAATHQSLLFLIIAVALAAVGAIAIVVPLNVHEDKMATYLFWVGFPIGLAIFTIKITFDAWLERRHQIRE
jgi:hypothetical protein